MICLTTSFFKRDVVPRVVVPEVQLLFCSQEVFGFSKLHSGSVNTSSTLILLYATGLILSVRASLNIYVAHPPKEKNP